LLDFFFPRECAGCRKEWNYLCADCKKTLHAHPEICPFCHRDSQDFKTCFSCKVQNGALEGIVVGFAYEKLMKKLILKVKFGHKKDIVAFLAERLALLVQVNGTLDSRKKTLGKRLETFLQSAENPPYPPLWKGVLYVSFVPSHRRRKYLEKGYNQSELLAKALANQLWLPMVAIAKKQRYTVSQLKLRRDQRAKNLKSAFVPYQLEQLPRNATILFVDDVTTTGSTLLEIARVIKKEREDVKIWGAVLARNMG